MTDVMRAQPRAARKPAVRLGRADQSPISIWFWEIDRALLMLVTMLIAIGLIAVAAGSPAAAHRYSGGGVTVAPLNYFWRQLAWVTLSIPVMLGVSMLKKATARRMCLAMAVVLMGALVFVPVIGVEVNGANRWLSLGFAQFQPSEFLKPAFVVSLAWLLSLKAQDASLPVVPLSGALVAVVAALLMMQPDFGQTVIFIVMWGTLLLLSGVSMRWIGGLALAAVGGAAGAYLFYPVATRRINDFLFQAGDTYQTDMAHATITAGGLFGTGPGGGTAKFRLPEAHTDYIFSVIGEEFGLIACAIVVTLYFLIIARVLVKLLDEEDGFTMLAAAGLATQFGVQAFINMLVNVGLAPAKGMTLPFISYGGSSMLALALGMGLLLAFTRRNPYLKRSPYVAAGAR